MGIRETIRRYVRSDPNTDDVHIGDPRYDEWPVVRDFDERRTARAFRQQLAEAGIEAVLTADWELDRAGRGDIALRVPGESYGDAETLLSGLDLD